MNGNPISFLPTDTINPAIQNLGQTLGAINQQKIGRQEGLQKQFAALLDASYGDIWANDQQEVTKDWEALKSKAINVFKTASEAGGPVNQMEYTGLMKDHKDLIRKAETARLFKEEWAKKVAEAAKLKSEGRLAPGVMEQYDAIKNNPGGSIYDRSLPVNETQYNAEDLQKLQPLILDPKIIARKENVLNANGKPVLDANGNPIMRDYYVEDNVRKALDSFAAKDDTGKWKRQVSAPFGGNFEKYKDSIVDMYDKDSMIYSKKRSDPYRPEGTVGNPYKIKFQQGADGRYHANLGAVPIPYIAQVEVLENGKRKMVDVPGKVVEVIDNNGSKTMKFIWTQKPQGIEKIMYTPDKNGAIELPFDQAIDSNIDNGKGVLDYEGLGGGKGQKSGAVIKLTGDEDASTLDPNKVYELDGQKVRWNGKNLVRQK